MLILELTRSATNLEQPAVESNVFVVIDYLQAPIENWTFYSLFYVEEILSFVTFDCTVVW